MLKWGSTGEPVKSLQTQLNLLPTKLAALKIDGIFGVRTNGRVLEFQGDNKLARDGVVGPLTADLIVNLLKDLNKILPVPPPKPDPGPSAVRLITDQVLTFGGPFNSADNMITQIIPAIAVVQPSSYSRHMGNRDLQFTTASATTARLAVFAAKKNGVERAVILVLPRSVNPDTILICISQGFGGQKKEIIKKIEALNWRNPLSSPWIDMLLTAHIVPRWAAQMLASGKPMGLMFIVRSGAAGGELGPFAADSAFLRQVLDEMRGLTNNAFSYKSIHTFTYSSGIKDHNMFLGAIQNDLPVEASYAIDPVPQGHPALLKGKRRMFWSGVVSKQPPMAGAEYLPLARWKQEPEQPWRLKFGQYSYMHGWVMPQYCLYIALRTP